jgi:hypothetical protein
VLTTFHTLLHLNVSESECAMPAMGKGVRYFGFPYSVLK